VSMVTVVGPLATVDGLRGWSDPWTGRFTAGQLSADDFRPQQPGDIPVDVDHDGIAIGRVHHLELMNGCSLDAVATIDLDAAGIDPDDGDWYWSAETLGVRRDGRTFDAVLDRLALVRRPAMVGLRPLTWLAGDVTDAGTRASWPVSWKHRHPAIARAAATVERRHVRGGPLVIERSATAGTGVRPLQRIVRTYPGNVVAVY
jgi:hypothetical protein